VNILADERMCRLCSAWESYHLEEIANFGYCARYALKTNAFERCETWDEKRAQDIRTHSSEKKTINLVVIDGERGKGNPSTPRVDDVAV
jgi:hypothetical protein